MIFYLFSVLAIREAIGHKVLFSSAFYTHALMAFGHPLAQKKGASYISDLGYRYNVQLLHYRGISAGQRVIAA